MKGISRSLKPLIKRTHRTQNSQTKTIQQLVAVCLKKEKTGSKLSSGSSKRDNSGFEQEEVECLELKNTNSVDGLNYRLDTAEL